MSVVSIATPFNIELEFRVSTLGKRILAWLIDAAVMLLYRLAYGFAVYEYLPDNDTLQLIIVTLTLGLPILLYHFLMEVFFHGQSIGKKLMGIRVVNFMGNEASISQYLIRLLFRSYFLVPLVASVIVALFYDVTTARWEVMLIFACTILLFAALGMFLYFVLSKYGQRLGDKLANTLVIEDQAKADFHKTIYLEIADQAYQVKYPDVMKLTDRDINGIRNLLDVKRITKEHEAYMVRIAGRITEVLGITTTQEPYDFLAQLLRDYNFLTSK
jgi:uncharacterized RDD family membrane protein YckC